MESYSYLLFSGKRTYIGATNDPDRRLRQHNGELSGGAYATKGKAWNRAVYVGGFPDWTTALQFEWAWKRHSRNKPGLQGKLDGLLKLLQTERPTKSAIPFHIWKHKFFLVFSPEHRQNLEKIEAYKSLLAMIAPPFPTLLSLQMSTITSVDVQSLSSQMNQLAATQVELMNKVNALTALLDAKLPEKKPRAKKEAVPTAEGDAAPAEKKKRGPSKKKDAPADAPSDDAPTDAAPSDAEAKGEEKPKKKRGPNKKKAAGPTDAPSDAAPSDAAPSDAEPKGEEKQKKKRGPNKKKADGPTDAAPPAAAEPVDAPVESA